MVSGTQLGNYAVEIIQMTLESAWMYEIHHFQLNFVFIYRKEVKIIAITYFLATLPILDAKNCNYALPSNRIDLGLVALDYFSPNLAFLCRNLDYKPYSINQSKYIYKNI